MPFHQVLLFLLFFFLAKCVAASEIPLYFENLWHNLDVTNVSPVVFAFILFFLTEETP